MRTLRLFLYFTALSGLLFGVGECVALVLGGSTTDTLLASGFVLLALGLGARFQDAGFVPLRASFALLGLAGALPLLAGFAPLSAAFSVFLFLPLRATGARLSIAVASAPAGVSLLTLGCACAWLLTTAWAPGLPGFLGLWLAAGILQRIVVPPTKEGQESPAASIADLLPALLTGVGLVLLFLFLSPYGTLFDSGALPQDLRRWVSLLLVFFLTWFTFGSGFAETRLRTLVSAFSAIALALLLRPLTGYIQHLSTPGGFHRWLDIGWLRELADPKSPTVPEENPLYVPVLTLVAFAISCALVALLLRTLVRRDPPGPGPNTLSPILGGAGVALLACGMVSSGPLLLHLGTLAAILLLLAGLAAWWNAATKPSHRWSGVAVVLILAGLFLRPVPRPILQHPLVDAFPWTPILASASHAWPQGTVLQDAGFFSLPRFLQRGAANPEDPRTDDFLFDRRNRLTPPSAELDARQAEVLLATSLAGQPQRICWVGVPNQPGAEILLENDDVTLTLACDPPSLGRMALVQVRARSSQQALQFQRGLADCDGPFDLVLIESSAMWESRHSVLRAELLRQASLRLEKGGVCVFLASPEDFVPGLLPQWIDEFHRVFPQTSVFLLADGLAHARILIAGRGAAEEGAAWPLPPPEIAQQLSALGLPLHDADDLAALEIHFPQWLGAGRSWLFRGPFRPADAALADTAYQLLPGISLAQRAASVLTELQTFEQPGHASLLGFYAAQFAAQKYSVHDTYLGSNPFALETSADALELLMRATLEFPDTDIMHRIWADVGVSLVESREVAWIEKYFGRLWSELQWQDAEVRLALAHSALEMLDFDLALEHLDAVLLEHPNFLPAKELKKLAEKGEQLPRDTHAGHDH